jgi:hypothetical protein
VKSVIATLQRASILGGTVPVIDGLRIAHTYGFIKLENGTAEITVTSDIEILPLCSTDEINTSALRRVLFYIIKNHSFHWIAFYNTNSDIMKAAIPKMWIEILELAHLFKMEDDEVLTWWKEVVDSKIKFDLKTNSKIGDAGEDLTCKFEVDRLKKDGIQMAEKRVVWMAQISDEYHYDIFSLRGLLLKEKYDQEHPINIEVKSSRITNDKVFSFYLTRPEWNKALKSLDEYYFYCWTGVKLDGTYAKGPFIFKAQQFIDKVPADTKHAKWDKCYFTLDLNEFALFVGENR